mgnify:CR=1 FL=1
MRGRLSTLATSVFAARQSLLASDFDVHDPVTSAEVERISLQDGDDVPNLI